MEIDMATVIHQSELLRRALAWLDEQRLERPGKSMAELMDEAGMRFNLSPVDASNLHRLVTRESGGKKN